MLAVSQSQKMLRRLSLIISLLIGLGFVLVMLFSLNGLPTNALQFQANTQVFPDYLQRSLIVQNYEEQVRKSPNSFLLLRLLAAQYLRRFRERADVGDLIRAEHAARRSLAIQPRNNNEAALLLASTLLSQHRFQEALEVLTETPISTSQEPAIKSLKASILMELGNYEAAGKLLKTFQESLDQPGQSAIQVRYLELTGHLNQAQQRLGSILQKVDSFYSNPAETRAWFHVRAGDLAFATGNLRQAEQHYQGALKLFPDYVAAFTGLARLYAAQHRWQKVLAMTNEAINRIPLVETLAYRVDAQRALGDLAGASETEALIETVARLSQVQGIYDRALAIYYIDHGIHLPEALEIARHELNQRKDIYAEDTLAWAAAANGEWQEAWQAIQRAARYGTEDALMQFHYGMIALHCGDRQEAETHLKQAIHLNPKFHHRYAFEAQQTLAKLSTGRFAPKLLAQSL
jgi:tetratricopeptide (TPR) repeat protein